MYHMSKPLAAHEAARAFAQGESHIRTNGALTFAGDVAWSYAEPIAVRMNGQLLVTDAKFSVTTSKHTGIVHGQWNVVEFARSGNHDDYRSHVIPHGELRQMVRLLGQGTSLGPWGKQYERQAA